MGRTRRLLGLVSFAALAGPPIAAAVARSRFRATAEDDDDLRLAAFFEGRRARVTATALRRGEALAWYGALDVDLRGASLDGAGGHLRVVAVYGGARVIVPAGWDVRVRSVAVFGGVDDRTHPPTGPAPRLTVDAVAAFGGIQVTDRPDEEEPDVRLGAPLADAAFARAEAEAELEAAVEGTVASARATATRETGPSGPTAGIESMPDSAGARDARETPPDATAPGA